MPDDNLECRRYRFAHRYSCEHVLRQLEGCRLEHSMGADHGQQVHAGRKIEARADREC